MFFKLITSVIFVLILDHTIAEIKNEIDTNEIDTGENKKLLEKPNNTLNLLEDDIARNTTSQDRISYHKKRGAPKYSRHSHHHHHHHGYHSKYHPRSHRSHRSRPHSKSHKKHRRNRRRPQSPIFSSPSIISSLPVISSGPSIISSGPIIPSGPNIISSGPNIISGPPSGPSIISSGPPTIIKSSHIKNPLKNKPILLSEVLRSGHQHSFAKYRPNNLLPRPVKEYVEEDELITSPFSSIDTIDSLPPTLSKFNRPPPSIEITGEGPDGLGDLSAIEDEIIYPGASDISPFATTFKRPPGPHVFSANKPSDIYLDDDVADNTRSVRFATKPPNNYIDQDILNLLQKMKQDGVRLESRPETSTSRNNLNDTSAAISKLLSQFLSESSIKQIQTYLNKGSFSNKDEKEEKNVNNVFYIVDNNDRDNKSSSDDSTKSFSLSQSDKEDDTNTTYFIMLKSPNNKNATTNAILQALRTKKAELSSTQEPETKTTTSLQNVALQNYIMSLAGLNQAHNKDFLPRFNGSLKKEPRFL